MSLPISSLKPVLPVAPLQPAGLSSVSNSGDAFQRVLSEAVNRVEGYRDQSVQSTDRFLSGENEEIHQVALDTQKAELSFELFIQMRNKVVQAYQAVMGMQL